MERQSEKKPLRIFAFLRQHPLLPATLSTGWNLLYAVFNGILAGVYSSWWFLTLCAFYAMLGFMRLSAVTIQKSRHRTEMSVMKHNGIAMIFLAVVLSGMVLLTIRETINAPRHNIVMITIATVTFFMACLAVRNMIKAHRDKSAQMITLRNISCAGAIASILSLERSMLATYGDISSTFSRRMEAASGAVAFVLLIVLGVGMIIHAGVYKRGNSSCSEK